MKDQTLCWRDELLFIDALLTLASVPHMHEGKLLNVGQRVILAVQKLWGLDGATLSRWTNQALADSGRPARPEPLVDGAPRPRLHAVGLFGPQPDGTMMLSISICSEALPLLVEVTDTLRAHLADPVVALPQVRTALERIIVELASKQEAAN